jgi:hypothetical protein
MPVTQVIEARRASILQPHDHLHDNQKRMFAVLSLGCAEILKTCNGYGSPTGTASSLS